MAKAHVPREIIGSASGGFATKPALAPAMIERAIAARAPFSFVAADSVYGVGASPPFSGRTFTHQAYRSRKKGLIKLKRSF
jgi:SRSO17 transposase